MAYMAKDLDGNSIPALGFLDNGAHSISVTGTTARNSTAFNENTRIVYIYATVDMFIRFGGSSVVATSSDHFISAGERIPLTIGGDKGREQATHIAAIRSSVDGTLYISEAT